MYRHKAVTAAKFLNQLITKLELATITMGIGTQVSIGYGAVTGLMGTAISPAYAEHMLLPNKSNLPIYSSDRKLSVTFSEKDHAKALK